MIDLLQPLTILVVEDSQTDFVILSEYLSLAALSVRTIVQAKSLHESVSLLHKKSFSADLIFLDLTLPDSQGLESFIQINAKAPGIPIVVLSELADIQVALSTIAHGAQDYLLKGEFDEKVLTKTIQYSIERKRIVDEFAENRLHSQKLIARATIQTHEQERKEIGAELHENINQVLATAKLCINLAMNENEKRNDLLEKSGEYISRAIAEIGNLSQSLVPSALFDIGLNEALEEMVEKIHKRHGLQIKLTIRNVAFDKLGNSEKLTIYRIVQEQLNNILKHSRANKAEIELRTSKNNFYLTIKDNGIGFNTENKYQGQGLGNIETRLQMHEGKLYITTAPQQGYTLNIEIPFA
ncbi:hybrid sensor histidine kinase/response regulator [Pinibacter soli]|uniref:Response regulator n=1 Tax=Pinibacter soli TaxID=3044211 RepID=A0ABT6RA34_9BACT|nr:response regulator [Pinibacter soli]MDI3318767.1 response regulator [Pinibacter soli]